MRKMDFCVRKIDGKIDKKKEASFEMDISRLQRKNLQQTSAAKAITERIVDHSR